MMTHEKTEAQRGWDRVLHPCIALLDPPDVEASSGRVDGIWLPSRTGIQVWWVDPALDADGLNVRLCAMEHCLAVPAHPSIATVRASGYTENGDHWVAIDRPPMRSLATVVERIDGATFLARARRLFEALVHLEAHNIVHGDLGPSMISVDSGSGEALIGGFGPGTHATILAPPYLDPPLEPAFASPEREAGREVTVRSDLYSLALTLYVYLAHVSVDEAKQALRGGSARLPEGLRDLFARMTADDPRHRPKSAKRALAELELVSAELEEDLPDEETSTSDLWRMRWSPTSE